MTYLTNSDLDWLRVLKCTANAWEIPHDVLQKLERHHTINVNCSITSHGEDVLLEQTMRDAEDR